MEAFFRILESGNNIVIVPRVKVVQDGHPILVYRYDIFQASDEDVERQLIEKAKLSAEEKTEDPGYLGELTFTIPDKVFTYEFMDDKALPTDDEQEIIRLITDIREDSATWNFYNENNSEQTD